MVALVLFQTLVRETIYSFIAPDCGNQAPITVITAWHAASSFTHSGRDSVSPVGIAALYMVLVRAQQDNANVSLFKLWKAMWTPVVTFRLYALIIIPAPKYWLSLWSQLVKKETWKCRYLKKHLTLVMVQIMDLFLAVYSLIYVPVPSRKLSYLLSFFFFFGLGAIPSSVLGHHSRQCSGNHVVLGKGWCWTQGLACVACTTSILTISLGLSNWILTYTEDSLIRSPQSPPFYINLSQCVLLIWIK